MKQVKSVLLIREQRDNGTQQLAFQARPFVLCGLPLRRPSPAQLSYTRRNGRFFLQIVAHPQFGLPFGQDRLIPIWVATLALWQKSREVHFDSAAQMLDFFHLPKDGFHYRRLVEAFQRIFGATIFFGTEENSTANKLLDWTRFHFLDRMKLWYRTAAVAQTTALVRTTILMILDYATRKLNPSALAQPHGQDWKVIAGEKPK